ncbi:MAG: hypothetical protein R2771_13640 [Saprospiraceae bacterium]
MRLNSSTHNNEGLIKKNDPESMANTKRLNEKIIKHLDEYTFFDLDHQEYSEELIVSYGVSAEACKDVVITLREENKKISFLNIKTLLPVAPEILEIINNYKKIIVVEENLNGIYSNILFGKNTPSNVKQVNKIGSLISPSEIIKVINS